MTYIAPGGFGSDEGSGSIASAKAMTVSMSPGIWGAESVTPEAVVADSMIGGVETNKGVSGIVEGADERVSMVVGCVMGVDAVAGAEPATLDLRVVVLMVRPPTI